MITYRLHSTFWWTLHLEPRRAIHGNCPNNALCPLVILSTLVEPQFSLGSRRMDGCSCAGGDNGQHTLCFLKLHLKRMLLSVCCWSLSWAVHSARDMHDNPGVQTESSSLAQFVCKTEFKERQSVNTAQCNNCPLKFSDSWTSYYNAYWETECNKHTLPNLKNIKNNCRKLVPSISIVKPENNKMNLLLQKLKL